MTDQTTTRPFLDAARAFVLECVPGADPLRLNLAAHQIVNQIEMVQAGQRGGDLARWRGAFSIPEGD
jgi:hypothetical protein